MLTACTSHGAKPEPTLPSSVTTAPSKAAEPGDLALVAYRGMWSAFVDAAKTSDSEAPELRTFTTDNALKLIVSSLYTNKQLGKVTRGEVALNPRVTKQDPSDAPSSINISDCVDDSHWLEYKASGGLYDNKPGGKHRTTAIVKRQSDGTWKVDSFALQGLGTC
jgi:hypothetical protein